MTHGQYLALIGFLGANFWLTWGAILQNSYESIASQADLERAHWRTVLVETLLVVLMVAIGALWDLVGL